MNMRYYIFCLLCTIIHSEVFAFDIEFFHQIAQRYSRAITCVVIGDHSDKWTEQLAAQYKGVFVLVDGKPEFIKHKRKSPNVIHLSRKYNSKILRHLGESEHFDIGIVSNHQIPLTIAYINSIATIAERVLVKIDSQDLQALPLLAQYNFFILGEDNLGAQYLMRYNPMNYQKRTTWYEDRTNNANVREIISTYDQKKLKKKYGYRPVESEWIPGINLVTFKMMGGSYPFSSVIVQEANRLLKVNHADLMPNNMIVQGKQLALIDFEDPYIREGEIRTIVTDEFVDLLVNFIQEEKTEKLRQHFDTLLLYAQKMYYQQ